MVHKIEGLLLAFFTVGYIIYIFYPYIKYMLEKLKIINK